MVTVRFPRTFLALAAATSFAAVAAPAGAGSGAPAREQIAAVPVPKRSPVEKAAPPHPVAPAVARPSEPSWGYDGEHGPAHWASLDPAYRVCGSGRQQSPIDISEAGAARLAPLRFHYKLSVVHLADDGKSLSAGYGPGSYLTVGTERYDLQSFSVHVPSEHTVAGRHFAVEIELDHRDRAGRRLVVSVLGTVGDTNLAAGQLLSHLPEVPGGKIADPRVLMNVRDLMPDTRRYFRYNGSLTVPPCTEGVSRIVLAAPMKLSEQQIARLHQSIAANARPVQTRHSRYLVQSVGMR